MKAYRAPLLRFDPSGTATEPLPLYEPDGLLVVDQGRVRAAGAFSALRHDYAHVPTEHWPHHLLAPGFIDLHIHYPQTDVIGSPADGLLPWLEHYTFPHESRFADPAYALAVADVFLDELQRHGVTTALTFATSHPGSVDALLGQAEARGLRMISGKVLQDQHSPDGVRDETEQSLRDTETLIQRWHGRGRLGYAITPRFVPTSSEAQLRGAGELAARYPSVWIQSHVAENLDEVRWVQQLYPHARSYLSVYGQFGLLRERAIYAHCIHLDAEDRTLMRDTGTAAAVSPTSNLFLGSGFFDYASAHEAGLRHGLASDVGGGTSFSPFQTMLAAYHVGRASVTGGGAGKRGLSLAPSQLWWQHTAGAAQALGLGLGLDGKADPQGSPAVGTLAVGSEADFLLLNPRATPLLARKTALAQSLEELLFSLIVLGDDRVVERVVVAGGEPHSLALQP